MTYCLVNETHKEILLLGTITPNGSDEDIEMFFDMSPLEDAYYLHRLLGYLFRRPGITVYVTELDKAPDYPEVQSID